ncbi:MAG: hypothetical protein IT564_06255 [Rhodospirillales bacterium]|nr:hypothetical protein [Rhodospirillales bacterium]
MTNTLLRSCAMCALTAGALAITASTPALAGPFMSGAAAQSGIEGNVLNAQYRPAGSEAVGTGLQAPSRQAAGTRTRAGADRMIQRDRAAARPAVRDGRRVANRDFRLRAGNVGSTAVPTAGLASSREPYRYVGRDGVYVGPRPYGTRVARGIGAATGAVVGGAIGLATAPFAPFGGWGSPYYSYGYAPGAFGSYAYGPGYGDFAFGPGPGYGDFAYDPATTGPGFIADCGPYRLRSGHVGSSAVPTGALASSHDPYVYVGGPGPCGFAPAGCF